MLDQFIHDSLRDWVLPCRTLGSRGIRSCSIQKTGCLCWCQAQICFSGKIKCMEVSQVKFTLMNNSGGVDVKHEIVSVPWNTSWFEKGTLVVQQKGGGNNVSVQSACNLLLLTPGRRDWILWTATAHESGHGYDSSVLPTLCLGKSVFLIKMLVCCYSDKLIKKYHPEIISRAVVHSWAF